jgi:hypothetical protein
MPSRPEIVASDQIVYTVHDRRNQEFLHSLFKLKKTNRRGRERVIQGATDSQIRALVKVLRLIWVGDIPISKIHEETLKKSRNSKHIGAHFFTEKDYKSLKSATISEQKSVLLKISIFHELLYNLFKKPRRRQ